MSPQFPTYSQDNQFCTWLITAPLHHVVFLQFLHFIMDESDSCKISYFVARDGNKSDSPILAKLCGSGYRCPIVSSGRYMWIRYKTKPMPHTSTQTNAFRAAYVARHKGSNNQGYSSIIHRENILVCRLSLLSISFLQREIQSNRCYFACQRS